MTIPRVAFLALSLIFAVFGSSIYYDFFIFDDAVLITKNDLVANTSLDGFLSSWSKSNTPLIINAWQSVNFFFGVDSAAPFRVLNLILHSLNSVLVFIWVQRFITVIIKNSEIEIERSVIETSAALAFLVFAFHPIQVESVVWVSSLKEVLSATFGLLSFIFYFKQAQTKKPHYEILTIVFFILGTLTHPTIAALPLVYIWLDYVIEKKTIKEILYRNGVYLIFLVAAVVIHKTVNPQMSPSEEQSLYIRLSVALNALLGYFEKIILPATYSFDYMLTPDLVARATKSEMWPKLKAFMSGLGIWGVIICYRSKKLRFIHFSSLVIILLVSVNLGLIGYAFQNISTIADRFLYFPIIGFTLFVAFLYLHLVAYANKSLRSVLNGLFVAYVLLIAGMTLHRVHLWRSSSSLLAASLENGFESYPLHISLGVALLGNKDYQGAIQHFEKAVELSKQKDSSGDKLIKPSSDEAYAHMFDVYKQSEDKVRGLYLYQQILSKESFISVELAWKIAEYLIEIESWYEAEKHVATMASRYLNSDLVTQAQNKLALGKLSSVIGSNINLGLFEMHNKNYVEANKFFNKALNFKKSYGLEHEELSRLIKENSERLKSTDKKPK